MKAINPATNELIMDYPEHTVDDVHDIIGLTDEAQKLWRTTTFAHRSQLMHQAAAVLRKNSDKYARIITVEMGKVINESKSEVEKCAWVCDYYADNAEKFLADEMVQTDASRSFVAFEPIGIVLAVMPWNFPFWQVFRFAAPALMAGNGGVLKHASNVPGSALAIEEIFREAGFPEHIFRTMLISSKLVEDAIKDWRIKAVTLTGSEPAGMSVASIAGRELKKTVLELGGSDPFIVLEDADLPACVATSATARMINAGQSCIAAKRFIVVEAVVKEFEKQQAAIMQSLKIGDPLDPSSKVGAMARMDLLEELNEQVQQSIEMGARLLCGGKKVDRLGAFYEPTVLTDVKKGMPVYEQETFGPVSAIIPVKDAEEAIAVANDSVFGLGGALWSKDIKKAEALARRIETGAVFINGMTKSDPRLPFGGIKRSGYGRELSHYGIREFVNIKSIWIA
ncbi:MAG: succinate-semialdehyde dehydrogenase [candidate division Zixibacteria bacterium HGW-Zixibacteria-1]|nr:MAG: succinate-semialdehyde dehydrogenase [candidate division Zixibacteria bacterium HGW-Zixibacteria-1]